ncbi:MAG: GNAT family N-acetyltransferase [Bacteroidales bacterium]
MNIIITKARLTDIDIIINFQQDMAMETEGMRLDPEVISAGVTAVFNDRSKGTYFVAKDGDTVVGSFLITPEWSDWRNSYVWWFQSVFVVPAYRRHGIFRMMYGYTYEKALKEGVAGLRLYVEKNNLRAIKTYEAMGMNGDHYQLFEWLKD